jgi:hypothetical protein
MPRRSWSNDENVSFIDEWNKGTPIAVMVTIFDIGQSSISHKAKKMGLKPRYVYFLPKDRKPKAPPLDAPPPPLRNGLTIMELGENNCRWLIEDKLYCGKPIGSFGLPYCAKHYKMSVQKKIEVV